MTASGSLHSRCDLTVPTPRLWPLCFLQVEPFGQVLHASAIRVPEPLPVKVLPEASTHHSQPVTCL